MADTQIVKVTEQKIYSSTYLIAALIAGLVLGSLISVIWFKTTKKDTDALAINGDKQVVADVPAKEDSSATSADTSTKQTTSTKEQTSSDTAQVSNEGGVLAIDDQSAGLSVAVARAQVSPDQWVVIREVKNGQPSNVLGAARFVGGAQSGAVELLRTTVAGQMYYGLIYKDNGDRVFSLSDDTPVRDSSGNQILVSFTAR